MKVLTLLAFKSSALALAAHDLVEVMDERCASTLTSIILRCTGVSASVHHRVVLVGEG